MDPGADLRRYENEARVTGNVAASSATPMSSRGKVAMTRRSRNTGKRSPASTSTIPISCWALRGRSSEGRCARRPRDAG